MNLFTLKILNTAQNNSINPNENLDFNLISFSQVKRKIDDANCTFSVSHNNLRSLQPNFEDFQIHLLNELDFEFDLIGISETKITNANEPLLNVHLNGYNFEFVPTPLAFRGVCLRAHSQDFSWGEGGGGAYLKNRDQTMNV